MAAETTPAPARNLTVEVQNWQLRAGVLLFAFALGVAVLLRELQVASPARWLLFLPFFMAFHGLHLGVTGVCGVSAAQGMRRTQEGAEPVCDRGELRAVRKRGAIVFVMTSLSALVVTFTLLH